MKNIHGNCVNEYAINVKTLLENLGFSSMFNNDEISFAQLNTIIQRVYDQYIQHWFNEIETASKLEAYKLFKDTFTCEKYLNCIENLKHRTAFKRFRCSAHKLMIEEGRYRNITRDERICRMCNMNIVESEYHFLLVCPFYRELRTSNLPQYYCSWPSIQKFSSLMKTKQKGLLIRTGKFIYLANLAGENYLNQ
jgi:hypothetical protein